MYVCIIIYIRIYDVLLTLEKHTRLPAKRLWNEEEDDGKERARVGGERVDRRKRGNVVYKIIIIIISFRGPYSARRVRTCYYKSAERDAQRTGQRRPSGGENGAYVRARENKCARRRRAGHTCFIGRDPGNGGRPYRARIKASFTRVRAYARSSSIIVVVP